jgi:flagellar assembly factor FliW
MTSDPTAAAVPVLEFVSDLPGFPGYRRFVLTTLHESDLVYALRSLEDPGLRFLVVPPQPFFPDYAPELDDASADLLGLTDPEDALLFLVVTTGELPEDASANLLAPIVVNRRTCTANQVVLSGTSYPLRAPLKSA